MNEQLRPVDGPGCGALAMAAMRKHQTELAALGSAEDMIIEAMNLYRENRSIAARLEISRALGVLNALLAGEAV